MSALVTTTESDPRKYLLLSPGVHLPRSGPTFQVQAAADLVDSICDVASQSEYLAIDFETKGGDYSDDITIVGLGLACASGSWYLDWTNLPEHERATVTQLLVDHGGLVAHNVYFDGGVAIRCLDERIRFNTCTLALYSLLANESQEQRHGLKHAMTDILGWADSNEQLLDEWLVGNGYYIGNRRLETDPAKLIGQYHARNAKGQRMLMPEKSEMWRAPADILGRYCVLDAEACYLLFTEVLQPTMLQFPAFRDYYYQRWMPHIDTHIWQRLAGINVDRMGLRNRSGELQLEIEKLSQDFLIRPDVSQHTSEIETELRSELNGSRPEQHTKSGKLNKNYINWEERHRLAHAGETPKYNFNMNSVVQMGRVLYDGLGMPVRLRTETGQPAVGKKAYIHMGEVGKLLIDRADLIKELSYIDKYIDLTQTRETIHPSFRLPGPVTGRLSSHDPNMTQIPKSHAVMSLFRAPPGMVLVDIDFAALESVIAAEFSQDPNMLELYRDGAPENDVHLFVASKVPGEMGQAVLKTGYRPVNPPEGTVSRAKKECKHWRSIAKTVVYACQFGAGVDKIMRTLEEDDVFLPRDQVADIHGAYWETFAGLKDFGKALWYEWRRNKGYILNGSGRPMAVYEYLTKDLLSRFVQSTGHDVLVMYDDILRGLLDQNIPEWQPVIWDLHDAVTVAVPEASRELAMDLMNTAMEQLNDELQGTIRMRGKPTSGFTLADVKEPET